MNIFVLILAVLKGVDGPTWHLYSTYLYKVILSLKLALTRTS